jgi:SAM-dependent methyltransferase
MATRGPLTWGSTFSRRRARRALERQLAYQEAKAQAIRGHEGEIVRTMMQASLRVRERLERIRPIGPDAPVLEVGSGAHGLIFYFGARRGVGVDPLAVSYGTLFPAWQQQAPTVAAVGEVLPFATHAFDIVLCDNVVDHAESPARIVAEMARVLAPSGLLYFTVNVHHPIYSLAARAHAAWNALGVVHEIGPFADHTTHLTLAGARRLFRHMPLRILEETCPIDETKAAARQTRPRHIGDRLKRVFFKNAPYEVIARREP